MYPDELYQLAVSYRRTKLWKTLYDTELFGVSLPDGRICYCTVMGNLGEHVALGLYVGNKGLDNYRSLLDLMAPGSVNALKRQELALSQDCVQCVFDNKDELTPEELSEARAYAAAHQISFRGRNAFPHFMRYRPAALPSPVSSEEDIQLLCAALRAALAVSGKLEHERKYNLGFDVGNPYDREIPLLSPEDGGFAWSMHPLPPKQPDVYPEPPLQDELLTARLRKEKKHCRAWVCDVAMIPQPVASEDGSAPTFPYALLIGNCDTRMVLPPPVVPEYESGVQSLLQSLGNHMLESGIPRQIQVVDERTYALLKNIAGVLKIQLTLQPENQFLDDIENDLLDSFMDQAPDEDLFFGILAGVDDDVLLSMPSELWEQMVDLDRQGLLNQELSDRIHRLLKRKK